MAKPGFIIMVIIAMAVTVASCSGERELFTPETSRSAE
jgi:hypothetical protein